jgi:Flp pilus assembly protein TadG
MTSLTHAYTRPGTAARRSGLAARLSGDRGSATGWAVGTILVGLLIVALVFDGAAAMTTRATALDVAQQAARAGADQLDLALLRDTGEVAIDPAAAQAAAEQWLAQAGVDGTVSATTAQVEVTVTVTQPTVLLAVVGIPTFTMTAAATAQPLPGQ